MSKAKKKSTVPKRRPPKRRPVVVLNVDINCTVEMDPSDYEYATDEDDVEGFLDGNLDLSYLFGNAWITSIDRVERME